MTTGLMTVDPDKDDTPRKKGPWWLTGLKYSSRASQPLLHRGLACDLPFREQPALGPASEPALRKYFLASDFNQ